MRARDVEAWIVARVARALQLDVADVDVRTPLTTLGVDSAVAVEIVGELEELLDRPLPVTLVYDHPTIEAVAHHLVTGETSRAPEAPTPVVAGEPIAVVGLACRVPGCDDAGAFWDLLRDGRDGLAVAEESPRAHELRRLNPGQHAGLLDRIDLFDAGFFGITPREALHMDPQQRLLLELAWEALEDGGIVPASLAGTRAGVYVGISFSEHGASHLHDPAFADGYAGTGNALSVAANRISYFLDLRGPSMAVDTACSSSLAGVHLACRSLQSGDCDLALVGAANVILSGALGRDLGTAGVLAPDGRCKTFDSRADGYVRSEGAGFLVLKPLSAAVAAGDRVYCTIRGSAVNHDGRTNGLLAPSPASQEALLRAACADAAADARDIAYIEAHGTGTLLGDAVEAQALGAVIGRSRPVGAPLRIGSVKSNLGHLEAAAGLVGMIKVALALHHRTIPPSIHHRELNENITSDALNLEVQRELTPWPDAGGPALAGVSSFGFGGANAHVVLSQAPDRPEAVETADDTDAADVRSELVTLSARTPAALDELVDRYLDSLDHGPLSTAPTLAALSRSAATRRQHHEHRLAVVASTRDELVDRLRRARPGGRSTGVHRGRTGRRPRRVAFVFAGQASRWWPWTDDGLGQEPAFRDTFATCQSIAKERWSLDLLGGLTGRTEIAPAAGQATFFAMQVSLAALHQAWGVQLAAVIGHSLGEVAAAVTAGCLSIEDGLEVAYHRGRCIAELAPPGRMAVVGLPPAEVADLIEPFGGRVVVAAVNSPGSVVISGEPAAVSQAVDQVVAGGDFGRVLDAVGFASHSPDMDSVIAALAPSIAHITPGAPAVPMVSTVADDDGRGGALGDAGYWARNLRQPVRLVDALRQAVADEGIDTFLEIGPEPGLGRSIRQSVHDDTVAPLVLPASPIDPSPTVQALATLAELYVSGVPLTWGPLAPHACALPTYPWQHESFWMEPRGALPSPSDTAGGALLGQRVDLADRDGHIWTSSLAAWRPAFLGDHVVGDEVVLPATAYVELARAAAAELGTVGPHQLRDLRLLAPLRLADAEDVLVQTVLSAGTAGSWSLRVYGRRPNKPRWALHAEGRLDTGRPDEAAEPTPPDHPVGLDEIDVTVLYQALADAGLAYGPAFRCLERLWSDGQRALGQVDVPSEPVGVVTFLDACLHTCAPLVEVTRPDRPWVPVACAAVVWHRADVPPRAVVHATASARQERSLVVDVAITDESGDPVVDVRGLRLQELAGIGVPDAAWTYRIEWEQKPPSGVEEATCSVDAAAPWLILADRGGAAAAIEAAFAAAGRPTQVVELFHGGTDVTSSSGRDALRARLTELRPPSGWRGIVVLWPLDLPSDDDDLDHDGIGAAEEMVLAAVDLLGALGTGLDAPPPVWFVTTGSPAAGPLDGIARVIPLELPDVRATMVDVGDAPASAVAEYLVREVTADGHDVWVAWRDGVRSVARLVPSPTPPATAGPPVAGTALVTGAFGALGSVLVRWLVGRGVRSFVLVGRNEPSPAAAALIEQLRSDGVQVVTSTLDVARRDEVERLLATLPDGFPTITGVFHLAGVLSDCALVDLGPDQFRRVLAPKVRGTWNLHHATRHLPLDAFVLFSSAVSVLGSPGQANYAAANAFLDAIARQRRSQGLPGLSINWGPWGEVGLAADRAHDARAQFASMFDPDEAADLVGRFLDAGLDQVLVLPYDLRNLLQHYPKVAGSDFFARVADETLLHGHSGRERAHARPDLATEHVAARSELERLIQSMWERALSIEGIGVRDGFFELGGDSVVANQVAVQIERRFRIGIDREAIFDDMTIEGVAALVEVELEKKLNELSDEAVDELLDALDA